LGPSVGGTSSGISEPLALANDANAGATEMMRRGSTWVVIPTRIIGDISADLLARLLRQAGVSREEWDKL